MLTQLLVLLTLHLLELLEELVPLVFEPVAERAVLDALKTFFSCNQFTLNFHGDARGQPSRARGGGGAIHGSPRIMWAPTETPFHAAGPYLRNELPEVGEV